MEEFDKLEYEQAYSFFRTIIQELFRVITILIIINATIIGISLETSIKFLFLGTIIQIIVLLANLRAGMLMQPIIFQIIKLEKKHSNNMPLMKMIAHKIKIEKITSHMEGIIDSNNSESVEQFFKDKKHVPSILSKRVKIIVIILAATQSIIPVIMIIIEYLNTMRNTTI